MSDRIEQFEVTVPAGTAIASPQQTALSFQSARVDRLKVFVPPGPSGLVGFQIAHSGQPIIPRNPARFIVTDNEHVDMDLDNYPTGDAWSMFTYNIDVYDHVLYVTFHLTEFGAIEPVVITPLAIEPLGTAEDDDLTPVGEL